MGPWPLGLLPEALTDAARAAAVQVGWDFDAMRPGRPEVPVSDQRAVRVRWTKPRNPRGPIMEVIASPESEGTWSIKTKAMPGPGRKLPPGQNHREGKIRVFFTPEETAEIELAAGEEGVSPFLRRVGLEAARRKGAQD